MHSPPPLILASKTREIAIGFDQPFCVIGERINPTGRKKLAEQMKQGDYSQIEADALAQTAAGAHMLDINAGIPLADEPAILAKCIRLVQNLVDVPLCIDSSIIEALEAGIAAYQGRALVNSVTGEEESLERVLPLVRKADAAVVGISNDENGIASDPDIRFAVAKKIIERAMDHGIARQNVLIDPLVMPIGAINNAARQVFYLIGRLRDELQAQTICGASNISFGLPNRHVLNGHFLSIAASMGMSSAIMNPLHQEEMDAIRAINTMKGFDLDCREWILANREKNSQSNARRLTRRANMRKKIQAA